MRAYTRPKRKAIAGWTAEQHVARLAGKGRFGACGLCLGLGTGEKAADLTPDEARLLENAVRWTAGREGNAP